MRAGEFVHGRRRLLIWGLSDSRHRCGTARGERPADPRSSARPCLACGRCGALCIDRESRTRARPLAGRIDAGEERFEGMGESARRTRLLEVQVEAAGGAAVLAAQSYQFGRMRATMEL